MKTLHWASAALLAAAVNFLVYSSGLQTATAADLARSSWLATKSRSTGAATPTATPTGRPANGSGHGAHVVVPVVYGAEPAGTSAVSLGNDSLDGNASPGAIGEGGRISLEQPSVAAPTPVVNLISAQGVVDQLPISESSWVSDAGGTVQPAAPILPGYGPPAAAGYPLPPMMPGMTPYAGHPGTFINAQHLNVGYAQQPLEPIPATPGEWTGADDLSATGCADGCAGGPNCDPGMFPCGALWGSGERVYVRMQYLNWQMDGVDAPAFVTTSPDGTPQNQSGVLGFPDTTILFGNTSFHGEGRSGARLTAGYWLSSDDVFGIEFDAWGLETSEASFFANSNGSPILARPFFNTFPQVGAPGQDSSIIARPNTDKDFPFFGNQTVDLAGNIGIDLRSEVWSGGVAIRDILTLGGPAANWRVDYLLGYRYFDLSESATFNEVIVPTGGPFVAGSNFVGRERFSADNYFNGGELGLASRYQFGCFTAEAVGRVALGNMHQKASISGNTTFNDPLGPPATVRGDFYAQPTNIGQYRQDKFAVIPELTLNLHYHITPQVRVLAGYSAVYVSNVVRAIDQIDTNLNQQRFWMEAGPGPPDPQFVFRTSEILLHGVNGGIEIRY